MLTSLLRGLLPLVLATAPFLAPASAHAAERVRASEVVLLPDALGRLTVADEVRDGYTPTDPTPWNSGLDPDDGCDTRAEVLLAEAVEAPAVGIGCTLTGGAWMSYYDGQRVDGPDRLDVVHTVPPAEAWDSGARTWTAARHEAYANDQGAEASLVAVTARSGRTRADQDPTHWLPPAQDRYCRYLSEWIGTKLRWDLTVDKAELETLKTFADGPCEETVIVYTPATA
ncbi:HNH endonuclease [Streptomyces roseolilacinus]|uniref:HNH endonuclease n=1 Tax=Streptomyces roseolilacinus TaxID=66904 RepID=UPI00381ED86F